MLLVRRGSTGNEGSSREQASQSRLRLYRRDTYTLSPGQQPRAPDRSRWGKWTCERALAARMPVATPTGTDHLDQWRSRRRENTCSGRQRDTHANWFAKQNTLSRQRLDDRADRTFTCVTQPSNFLVLKPLAFALQNASLTHTLHLYFRIMYIVFFAIRCRLSTESRRRADISNGSRPQGEAQGRQRKRSWDARECPRQTRSQPSRHESASQPTSAIVPKGKTSAWLKYASEKWKQNWSLRRQDSHLWDRPRQDATAPPAAVARTPARLWHAAACRRRFPTERSSRKTENESWERCHNPIDEHLSRGYVGHADNNG